MDNKDFAIIKINIADVAELKSLSRQTFFESYSWANTRENIQNYMDASFSEARLKQEINNPYSEFYFGKLDGKVVGYFKINFGEAQTDLNDNKSLEIERIYVSKELQGNNIGKIFIEKAVDIAERKGLSYLWLGVWDKNTRAIKFYERNGFVPFGSHHFFLGSEEQTDVMMKRDI